jgi:cytochrome c oxidase subunit 2
MDMIPGRVTRLVLTPTREGRFRGACAEFCGTAHAQMNFEVVVMAPDAFRGWVAAQAEPASPPGAGSAQEGWALFMASGCDACHTIRGTRAEGRIGPDLTHVGSRLTLGAGLSPNGRDALIRWIADTHDVKPGVRMPAYGILPPEEIALIADYLMGLK